jgi:hypothetical protein
MTQRLDAELAAQATGARLSDATILWVVQLAQRQHATLCTCRVALTDAQKLLQELDAEPEILAELQLVLDTITLVQGEAE